MKSLEIEGRSLATTTGGKRMLAFVRESQNQIKSYCEHTWLSLATGASRFSVSNRTQVPVCP